jgi:multicomponent Na+:H+ antiporter subunit F
MPDWLFNLAIVWLALLIGVTIVLVIRARSITVRLLAADLLTLLLVALLVVFAQHERSAYYFDAALILALLTFVGTVAAGRYYRLGRPF